MREEQWWEAISLMVGVSPFNWTRWKIDRWESGGLLAIHLGPLVISITWPIILPATPN